MDVYAVFVSTAQRPLRAVPEWTTITITVELTPAEADALRDCGFPCMSTTHHKAGNRAIETLKAEVLRRRPRPQA